MTGENDKRILSKDFENDQLSLSAAETVTFNMGTGDDTETAGVHTRYLNLETSRSHGIEVIPTVACSITKINNKTLKAPISVGTGGIRMTTGVYTSITIQAGSATVVEILAKT